MQDSQIKQLVKAHENKSWINSLNEDPESDKYKPNKQSRPVKSGHYVLVKPTPLPNPHLVTYSSSMASTLKFTDKLCNTTEFVSIFSGNDIISNSWATPYALSIYGQEMYTNCPFKNDTGYGDGRAISLTELIVKGVRWELQLKGAGKTPFCRSGDGRAVLRSSVREFLASEAMFHLNVWTTRVLSLIASDTETVARPWFSSKEQQNIVQKHDIMQQAKCAMVCRVASSFLRVGHLELFSRRTRKGDSKELRLKELELIVKHTIFREYGYLNNKPLNFQDKVILMLKDASKRFAILVANWLRVGFVQGNFNSDNCHVGGLTIDYGPFGFMEKFNVLWNPWIDGGSKFAFMNQIYANNKNFDTLVNAVLPLFDEEHKSCAEKIKKGHLEVVINQCNKMWAKKLGFERFDEDVAKIKYELFELMESSEADYTLLFRHLADVIESDSISFELIEKCFYKKLNASQKQKWMEWMQLWIQKVRIKNKSDNIGNYMKTISPKFVLREWMLTLACDTANEGNYNVLNELKKLCETPYDEHINDGLVTKYYKLENINKGSSGTNFIS